MKKTMLALLLSGTLITSSLTAPLAYAMEQPGKEAEQNEVGSEQNEVEAKQNEVEAKQNEMEAKQNEMEAKVRSISDPKESSEPEGNKQGLLDWKSDLRLGIKREAELIREAQVTWEEWDLAVEERRQKALASPLTREELLGERKDLSPKETKGLSRGKRVNGRKKRVFTSPAIFETDGQITFLRPTEGFLVKDALDAYQLAYGLLELCALEEAHLVLWNVLTSQSQVVYTFQRVLQSATVEGSLLKIATDLEGNVTAILPSRGEEEVALPQDEEYVTPKRAEKALEEELVRKGEKVPILSEYTERVSIPDFSYEMLYLDSDLQPQEHLYWIVYTAKEEEDFPYLAHYLSLSGQYCYSLPVKEPGDEDAHAGVTMADPFEGMEPGEYTTVLTKNSGEQVQVSLPLMYSDKTGLWYLGDCNDRIAIADYHTFAYGEDHRLELLSSDSRENWDPEDLFLLYNYLKAARFYREMGWEGPAGSRAPVIILRNLCTEDKSLMVNACSMGPAMGYQFFGYTPRNENGEAAGLGQALDVMIHEYTHTFTSTMMVSNLYLNDAGAINEAMSDILGNLGEYILEAPQDTKWLISEACANPIRSMAQPEDYSQPRYTWDLNYGAPTTEPGIANDRGGVHTNSSLLNYIAAQLCLEYGMSYEQALRLWTTVAMCITPEMDHPQMAVLLRHAIKASGNGDYEKALDDLIEETRLEQRELPEMLPVTQQLIRLQLPDTEAFEDKDWSLFIYQLDTKVLGSLATAAVESLLAAINEEEFAPQMEIILDNLARNLKLGPNKLEMEKETQDIYETIFAKALNISVQALKNSIRTSSAWCHGDTKEILTVVEKLPSLYLLMNLKDGGARINGFAILINDRWVDLSGAWSAEEEFSIQTEKPDLIEALNVFSDLFQGLLQENESPQSLRPSLEEFLKKLYQALKYAYKEDEPRKLKRRLEELFAVPTVALELPSSGLEKITLSSEPEPETEGSQAAAAGEPKEAQETE